jgi:hypothetical protein
MKKSNRQWIWLKYIIFIYANSQWNPFVQLILIKNSLAWHQQRADNKIWLALPLCWNSMDMHLGYLRRVIKECEVIMGGQWVLTMPGCNLTLCTWDEENHLKWNGGWTGTLIQSDKLKRKRTIYIMRFNCYWKKWIWIMNIQIMNNPLKFWLSFCSASYLCLSSVC